MSRFTLAAGGRAFAQINRFHPELTAFRRDLEPSMGSEDFSFMLKVKLGAYLRLGQGEQITDDDGVSVGGPGSRFLHNSCYDFNDSVLPLGSALFAGIVERSLPLA